MSIYRAVYQLNVFSAQGSLYKASTAFGQSAEGLGNVPPPEGDFIVENVISQAISTNDGFAIRLNI